MPSAVIPFIDSADGGSTIMGSAASADGPGEVGGGSATRET